MNGDDRASAIGESIRVLETSAEPSALVPAALTLARSDDPAALQRLGDFLSRREFLARLDDPEDVQTKGRRLQVVMRELAAHPSPEVAALALRLSAAPEYREDDDRTPYVLDTLAAIRPMSEESAAVFRQTNEDGYFAFNARLLARNGSPIALALFETMMADRDVPVERRVDCLHSSVMPHRTHLPVLEMSDRLLGRDLENEVALGVIESVFDYQGKPWFGPHAPAPPLWRTASTETLRFLVGLAAKVRGRPGVPPRVVDAIDQTVHDAQALLAARAA